MKLVIGQIMELERLGETLEIAKDERELLGRINEGVNRTLNQIESIEEIILRAQRLDPKDIRRIADLNMLLEDLKDLKSRTSEILETKVIIVDHALFQSALQAETAYTMGQEMVKVGSNFTHESRSASPGRAACNNNAAAAGAQTLSNGVLLQTLSHLTELQALSLELQKSKLEQELLTSKKRSETFKLGILGRVGAL